MEIKLKSETIKDSVSSFTELNNLYGALEPRMLPKAAHSFGVGSVNRLRIHQRRTISVGDMISYSSLTDADVVASVVKQEGENNNFDDI